MHEHTSIILGEGEAVRGSTLAVIMAMTGRGVYWADLTGPGVTKLIARAG